MDGGPMCDDGTKAVRPGRTEETTSRKRKRACSPSAMQSICNRIEPLVGCRKARGWNPSREIENGNGNGSGQIVFGAWRHGIAVPNPHRSDRGARELSPCLCNTRISAEKSCRAAGSSCLSRLPFLAPQSVFHLFSWPPRESGPILPSANCRMLRHVDAKLDFHFGSENPVGFPSRPPIAASGRRIRISGRIPLKCQRPPRRSHPWTDTDTGQHATWPFTGGCSLSVQRSSPAQPPTSFGLFLRTGLLP